MEDLQEIDVEKNLLLSHPFTMLIAGSTGSGKTVFTRDLLSNFDKITNCDRPINVTWAYGIQQDLHHTPLDNGNVRITYVNGFPETTVGADVLVLDDLQTQAGDDKRLGDLFTRFSHHKKTSIIFIVQNLYLQSKQMRNVSLNSHFLVLLASRRDRTQIARLAAQLYPGETGMFMQAYKDALSREFGYLFIDLTPTTREEFRLRTNIFPIQYPIIIYQKADGL